MGQQGTVWTRVAKDREGWSTLAEDYFLQWSWLLACLTSQQHASVSQERIFSDKCTCCHTEIEVANQTITPSHSILTPVQPVPALPFNAKRLAG